MRKDILVSIVVPIYNQEKYLDISIPSLINQTYSNIELVLVNDGSTDNSKSIIQKYANEDERIAVVEKENGGLVDATIAGIIRSTGDYVAFLDPDDYIGNHFIENFIDELDKDYDFIASGFYKDNNGKLNPFILDRDVEYDVDLLKKLRKNLIFSKNSAKVPQDIFVSRWNKMYRRECLNVVVEKFENYRDISLGEDSIFTYLLLSNCVSGKAIQACNTYYYNIGNQNSMMKTDDLEKHLTKARTTFEKFTLLLKENGDTDEQAYALYYHLVDAVVGRTRKNDNKEFKRVLKTLGNDNLYKESLRIMKKRSSGLKEKSTYLLRQTIKSPRLYNFLTLGLKKKLRKVKKALQAWFGFFKDLRKGIAKSYRLLKFKKDRRNAFKDIYVNFSLLEERIVPLLSKFQNKTTDFSKSTIEKNIFVFWWDGFEKAPMLVQKCLESVKRHNRNSNVIEITKDTYKDYTDINQVILDNFEKGKISVQTFSDILRFNLLKNNGGTWVDATIFFAGKYDLTEGLENKPIESVEFATSKDYIQYKGETCSWSGFFISSRKNSVFVNAVDYIFEQYYLKYKTYSIYFFIDAVLMICKLNKVDGGALDNISYNSGDMFILGKLLYKKYSPFYSEVVERVPQKLQWGFKYTDDVNTNYQKIIMKEE